MQQQHLYIQVDLNNVPKYLYAYLKHIWVSMKVTFITGIAFPNTQALDIKTYKELNPSLASEVNQPPEKLGINRQDDH